MDLSTLTIRQLFAELSTVEDSLREHPAPGRSARAARLALHTYQDRLCAELHSRTGGDTIVPLRQESHFPG